MPIFRVKSTGNLYFKKHKYSKYPPHYGAKESAKFSKRQQEKELKCAATS